MTDKTTNGYKIGMLVLLLLGLRLVFDGIRYFSYGNLLGFIWLILGIVLGAFAVRGLLGDRKDLQDTVKKTTALSQRHLRQPGLSSETTKRSQRGAEPAGRAQTIQERREVSNEDIARYDLQRSLETAKTLYESGILTREEYSKKRQSIETRIRTDSAQSKGEANGR